MNDTTNSSEQTSNGDMPLEISPEAGEIHTAHWHIFVPTAVIATLYLCGLVFLWLLGRADGSLARLFIIVLTVAVPLLIIHALLRYNTSSVQLTDETVRYHRGWPARNPVELPYLMLESVSAKRGLSGLLFGGGTLVMKLRTGDRVSVPDLREPERIRGLLSQKIGSLQKPPQAGGRKSG